MKQKYNDLPYCNLRSFKIISKVIKSCSILFLRYLYVICVLHAMIYICFLYAMTYMHVPTIMFELLLNIYFKTNVSKAKKLFQRSSAHSLYMLGFLLPACTI